MIAALFVDGAGVYSGRPDVEVWPWARDARRYAGPWPVVGHPPCALWGWHARSIAPDRLGLDGGCFRTALGNVHRVGGVLEHPASSSAWTAFGLQRPGGWGWTRGPDVEAGAVWVCAVDQGHYGHRAPKRTWLYLVTRTWDREPPPPLAWSPSGASGRVLTTPHKRDREATPPLFAEVLLALVRGEVPPDPVTPPAAAPVTVAGALFPELVGVVCELPGCGRRFVPSGPGPDRRLCSPRCRQRASRQARVVTRARDLGDRGTCDLDDAAARDLDVGGRCP